jgi:hypothetical protein
MALAGAVRKGIIYEGFRFWGKAKTTHPATHDRLLAPLLWRTRSVDLSASNILEGRVELREGAEETKSNSCLSEPFEGSVKKKT